MVFDEKLFFEDARQGRMGEGEKVCVSDIKAPNRKNFLISLRVDV